MFDSTESLYAELAEVLGIASLPADDQGSVELAFGEDTTVLLFAEDAASLMLVVPVMPLPASLDYGRLLWLLQRNFHDSAIAPFRVCCDAAATIVLWGRVPTQSLDGAGLAGLAEALADEARVLREELGPDTVAGG